MNPDGAATDHGGPARAAAEDPDPPAAASAEERLQKALALAFAYLNRRERTVGEVERYLERKGIGDEIAAAALQGLLRDGYLDDSRYALMYVHDKRQLEGWGSDRIRRELANRGLDRELIEEALIRDEAERGDGETEFDRALALLRRRFPSPPVQRRDRDRALGMLIRKGFDVDLAVDALGAHARAA